MLRRIFLLILPVVLATFISCKTYKPITTRSYSDSNEQAYIDNYKALAISEMKRTGIPASITLGQALIESDAGNSRLAREANNHFGIKCHDNWKGPTVRHNDDRKNECFRKYSQPEGSYRDHSDFLMNVPRYKSLFFLDLTDYKGWARGLQKAGYATNPDYSSLLIKKIEQYNLSQYDNGLLTNRIPEKQIESVIQQIEPKETVRNEKSAVDNNGNFAVSAVPARIMERNRIQYIIVKDGETKESIEKEFQLLGWELARYNELSPGFLVTPGQIMYLQPKREKAEAGKDFHTVSVGETMYQISQIYGIKLKSLLIMNRMEAGQNPSTGQKIWLRSVKPAE